MSILAQHGWAGAREVDPVRTHEGPVPSAEDGPVPSTEEDDMYDSALDLDLDDPDDSHARGDLEIDDVANPMHNEGLDGAACLAAGMAAGAGAARHPRAVGRPGLRTRDAD